MSLSIFIPLIFPSKKIVYLIIYSDCILCHSVKFCGFPHKKSVILYLFKHILAFNCVQNKLFYTIFCFCLLLVLIQIWLFVLNPKTFVFKGWLVSALAGDMDTGLSNWVFLNPGLWLLRKWSKHLGEVQEFVKEASHSSNYGAMCQVLTAKSLGMIILYVTLPMLSNLS